MVGGGIYALVGEVAAVTGGAIWSGFLLALVLAAFTAFSYAELVTKYPRAGGAASYVHAAFRSPFLSFLMAFAVVMSGVTSASALGLAFGGEYLGSLVDVPPVAAALGFVSLLALINLRGIGESVTVNAVCTIIELVGLLLIVAIGVAALAEGSAEPARALELAPEAPAAMAVLAGAALAFYALIGFEDSVNLAEETRDPSRSYPRALLGGIAVAGTVYLAVTVTAAMVVPTAQLAASSGPLLEVVRAGPLPVPPRLFALIALFALANGALINLVMASRLIYGMGDQGILPPLFARVHAGRRTPWVAIALTTAIAFGLIATGDLGGLARTTVLLLLVVFLVVNVTVLILRRDRVGHAHFRAPTILPVLGALVCAGMLTQQGGEVWLRSGVLLAAGAALYGLNAWFLRRSRASGRGRENS